MSDKYHCKIKNTASGSPGITPIPSASSIDGQPFIPDNNITHEPDIDYGCATLPNKSSMSPEHMDELMFEFINHLMKKCAKKNKAYAETDVTADALNNFREAADDFGISMNTYAMILQGKHYRAWKTFVRTGEAPDKPFRILGDIIVYALIMYCIGIDQGTWTHEEVLEDED